MLAERQLYNGLDLDHWARLQHQSVDSSDAMKLVKVGIRQIRILTFKIRRMRIEVFIISVKT